MKIVGLRVEKYIGQKVSGHNCDFEYTDAEFEKHIICCTDKVSNGETEFTTKFEIELSHDEGECGSGYCAASYGSMKVNQVEKFNGFTHLPINPLTIPQFGANDDDVDNDVFHYSCDGGCGYYPNGGYSVKMELFEATPRAKTLRPTYVFIGESGIGKSFLASKFGNTIVFETDAYEELPNKIIADVIVLGNRYPHTIDDIHQRVRETELVICYFNHHDIKDQVIQF